VGSTNARPGYRGRAFLYSQSGPEFVLLGRTQADHDGRDVLYDSHHGFQKQSAPRLRRPTTGDNSHRLSTATAGSYSNGSPSHPWINRIDPSRGPPVVSRVSRKQRLVQTRSGWHRIHYRRLKLGGGGLRKGAVSAVVRGVSSPDFLGQNCSASARLTAAMSKRTGSKGASDPVISATHAECSA
jgi:hypothetical protein